eukprot:6179237-Pleurochrysis_carterae.AAC.1
MQAHVRRSQALRVQSRPSHVPAVPALSALPKNGNMSCRVRGPPSSPRILKGCAPEGQGLADKSLLKKLSQASLDRAAELRAWRLCM